MDTNHEEGSQGLMLNVSIKRKDERMSGGKVTIERMTYM